LGAGGTLDGALNIAEGLSQGLQTLQGEKWLGKMLSKPLSAPLLAIQGVIGLWDYGNSAYRLVADSTIVSEETWTERVGVAAQGIGGAFLVAGVVTGLAGAPVAAVLLRGWLSF